MPRLLSPANLLPTFSTFPRVLKALWCPCCKLQGVCVNMAPRILTSCMTCRVMIVMRSHRLFSRKISLLKVAGAYVQTQRAATEASNESKLLNILEGAVRCYKLQVDIKFI